MGLLKGQVVTEYKERFSPILTKQQLAAGWRRYLLVSASLGRITFNQAQTWINPFEK